MFGSGATVAVPDVDRTDHLLILGANPLASNGSLLTAPDMRGRLRAIRARGGKIVVIDPRRTRTAREADEHHFIRPGTDALLLLALAHALFDEELVDARALGPHLAGLDEVRALAGEISPEAVARHVRDRGAGDPAHGPRAGGRAQRRGLRAHRHHHAALRDDGQLAGRRAQRPHRQPRPPRRRHVPAHGDRLVEHGGRARARARRGLRALAQPRARAGRGLRRAARGLPGRGDRDARRGPGPRADDRSRATRR